MFREESMAWMCRYSVQETMIRTDIST